MRRPLLLGLAILSFVALAPPVSTQHLSHGLSGLPQGIPDYCAKPTATIIPMGSTWPVSAITQPLNAEILCVRGELALGAGARLVTGTTIFLPGSVLTSDAPNIEWTITNTPIDLTFDPEQFGTGILGLGGTLRFAGVPDAPLVIQSAAASGTRGHILLHGRADVEFRHYRLQNLGRTDALRPLDSTTFDAAGAVTHIGTNQIGRYSLHAHHLLGLPPGSGKPYQFRFEDGVVLNDSKWGIVAHRSSFGLIARNRVTDAPGACFVEEDGSETANQWIENVCDGARNPTTPAGAGYDPEGRWGSGFWLRGINQVLRGNVVRNARTGFGWWTGCLEVTLPHVCSLDTLVRIPTVPGADVTLDANVQTCVGRDGALGVPCTVAHRRGLAVDGNRIENADIGLDHWWTLRSPETGFLADSPPITNTTFVNVADPIQQSYSDVRYDGGTVTGGGWLLSAFNDAHPIGRGTGTTAVSHFTATGLQGIFHRTGQLHLGPSYRFATSTFGSVEGIVLRHGGQRVVGYPVSQVAITEVQVTSGPLITVPAPEVALPEQRIVVTADAFRFTLPSTANTDCTATHPLVVGTTVCLTAPTPPVVPDPPSVAMSIATCRYVVTGAKPDSTTGWAAQFRRDGVNVGTKDSAPPYQRTFTIKPGAYTWDVVWTKTGEPPRTSLATSTGGCVVAVAK